MAPAPLQGSGSVATRSAPGADRENGRPADGRPVGVRPPAIRSRPASKERVRRDVTSRT